MCTLLIAFCGLPYVGLSKHPFWMLRSNDVWEHPYLALDLSGKASSFSLLSTVITMGSHNRCLASGGNPLLFSFAGSIFCEWVFIFS